MIPLQDNHGRKINYLRLSVTDRCDFRCTYCMGKNITFLPHHALMRLEESLLLIQSFVRLGVDKVRITGGEPLVRRNILWLLEAISRIPGLKQRVLTTNGSQLERYAVPLFEAGIQRINVSLDSLKPDRFRAITRVGDLTQVLLGLKAASAAGFKKTKLNTVMMQGVNDDEFIDLVRFACEKGFDITFIEAMPFGEALSHPPLQSDTVLARLQKIFRLSPSPEKTGGPANYWHIEGSDSRIGFISPHTHNFCADCNRVRVSAAGKLYPCLGQHTAIDLLPTLRHEPETLDQVLIDAIAIKPAGHDFQQKITHSRSMSETGG